MKALRTVVLDHLYDSLTEMEGHIFELGRGSQGQTVYAEIVLARRKESSVELEFLCRHRTEEGETDETIKIYIRAGKQ